MSKNKQFKRIFSLILAISMLLSFSPYVMADEATDTSVSPVLPYVQNFDSKEDADLENYHLWLPNNTKDSKTAKTLWAEGGFINHAQVDDNHYQLLLEKDFSSEVDSEKSVIVYEARMKIDNLKVRDGCNADGKISVSRYPFMNAATTSQNQFGLRAGVYNGFFSYTTTQGGNVDNNVSNYPVETGKFYTFKIKYNVKTRKATFGISDGTTSYTSPEINEACGVNLSRLVVGSSRYYSSTVIDYVKIYDESKLPTATVAVNDGVDVNAVKENDTFTVTLENAITQADLDASPVTVNDSDIEVASVLSEDGKKITLTVSNLASTKEYTLTVPDLGLNVGTTLKFKSAQADYVLYANYFDTAEDVENSGFTFKGNALTADAWKNGNFNYMNTNPTGPLLLNKDISSKLTDNSVVVYETRKQVYSYSGNDTPFASNRPLFVAGADNHQNGARIYAVLNEDKTTAKLYLTLNSGSGATVSPTYIFAENFAIKKGHKDNLGKGIIDETGYFTYTIKYDVANKKVKAIVSNYNGTSVAESDWYAYPHTFDTSYSVHYTNYYTGSFVDSHIIYDESKLPKAKLAETDLKNLKDGSTLTIKFDQKISESDLSKITVTGGAEIEKTLSDDKKSVTLTFSNVENLKSYTLKVENIGMNLGFTETLKGADYDYMLYRNDFDTAEDVENNGTIYFGMNGNVQGNLTASNWVSGGYLENKRDDNNHIMALKDIDFSSKLNDDSVVVWEARIKHTNNHGGSNADGNHSNGTVALFGVGGSQSAFGLRVYGKDGSFAWSAVQGTAPGSAGFSSYNENYKLKSGEFYTYTIKYNKAEKKAQFKVYNETQGEFVTDWVSAGAVDYNYVILTGSLYLWKTTVDYVHIYDESLIPAPEVTGADLMNVKNGDVLKIELPFAVTADDVTGKVKFNGNVVDTTLSADGKTLSFTLSGIELRTKYTLSVGAMGQNPALSDVTIRGGEEGKYYYRAEFDGNDDTSKIYSHWGNSNFDALNTAAISNGVLDNSKISYRRYSVVFGNGFAVDSSLDNVKTGAIDVAGKENVVFETKIKFNGNNIWTDQNNFLVINRYGIVLGYNNGLMYAAGSGNPDTYFKVNEENYQMLADTWYTITIRMNFATSRYTVSVSDGKDVATSGTIPFMYYNKHNTITGIGLPSRYDNNNANLFVDYIHLYDDDYGKAEVTYNNGTKDIPLDGNVLVTGSETYTFEALSDISGDPVITAKTADGTVLNVNASKDGRKVTFNITDSVPADTQIYVTIAKETLGAEKDQVVSFRTKWNADAEFVTPEMFKDKDTLEVVFFGGSITAQDGWRTTVTNGLNEMFAGKTVNCYNESWGGTGAEYGWTRLDKCVKSHNPDVVFVEYAVNDSTNSGAAKYMESVIRSMNAWDKKPVIILVYTTKVDFRDNAWACSEHTRVAEAYGVPYISAREYVMSKYNEDDAFAADWDAKKYLGDGTHTATTNPDGSKGFALYGDYVNNLLKHHSDHYFKLPKANSEVAKLDSASREDTLAYTANTTALNEIGDSAEFTFSGDELVLEIRQRTTTGKYTLTVDNTEVTTIDSYTNQARPSATFYRFSGFGSGEHTAKVAVAAAGAGDGTKVEFIGYYQLQTAKASFAQPTLALSGSTVKATFGYTAEVDTAVTFILAAYKADGTLANIQFVPTTVVKGSTSSDVTMADNSNYASFKAFVWDSLGSMQAKCVSGEFVKNSTSAE